MIKQIEGMIIDFLGEYSCSGLSEEQLFNYVVARVGTGERPIHLDEYEAARANLSERIVEREVVLREAYGGPTKKKSTRLFLGD